MAYGIKIRRSDGTEIASMTTPGGGVFIDKVSVAYNATQTFTFPTVSSGNYLRVIQTGAGNHLWTTGTNGSNQATLTATARSSFDGYGQYDSEFLIFTTQVTEDLDTDYGVAVLNSAGERIISAQHASPEFVGKVSSWSCTIVDTTPTGYTHLQYTSGSISLGLNRTVMVFWNLPSSNTDTWYATYAMAFSSASPYSIEFEIFTKEANIILPEAFVFALDGLTAGSDGYGIRIRDSSGNITFDSGINHLILSNITDALEYPRYSSPGTINTINNAFNVSNPAFYIPNYFEETLIRTTPLAIQSYLREYRGTVKRVGTTIYTQTIQSAFYIEDYAVAGSGWTFQYGEEAGLYIPSADSTLYGGTTLTSTIATPASPSPTPAPPTPAPPTPAPPTPAPPTPAPPTPAPPTPAPPTPAPPTPASPSFGSWSFDYDPGQYNQTNYAYINVNNGVGYSYNMTAYDPDSNLLTSDSGTIYTNPEQRSIGFYQGSYGSYSISISLTGAGSSSTTNEVIAPTPTPAPPTPAPPTPAPPTPAPPTPAPAPVINSFSISPSSGIENVTVYFTWNVTGSDLSVSVSDGTTTVSDLAATGSSQALFAAVSASKTYTLTASNIGGSVNSSQNYTYTPSPVINVFSFVPSTVNDGDSIVATWDTTYADTVTINGNSVAVDGTAVTLGTANYGTQGGSPSYLLVATNAYNSVSTSRTLTINAPIFAYFVLPSGATSVDEGNSTSFEVETQNVANGATLYWRLFSASSPAASSADVSATTGSFVSNRDYDYELAALDPVFGRGTFSITASTDDEYPESGESYYVKVYLTATDRNNDTNAQDSSPTITITNTTPAPPTPAPPTPAPPTPAPPTPAPPTPAPPTPAPPTPAPPTPAPPTPAPPTPAPPTPAPPTPAPSLSASITPTQNGGVGPFYVNETTQNSITFDYTITNRAGKTVWWGVSGFAGVDTNDFPPNQYGSISSDSGQFTVTIAADNLTEGSEAFTIYMWETGAYSGDPFFIWGDSVTIGDTSLSPTPTPPPPTPAPPTPAPPTPAPPTPAPPTPAPPTPAPPTPAPPTPAPPTPSPYNESVFTSGPASDIYDNGYYRVCAQAPQQAWYVEITGGQPNSGFTISGGFSGSGSLDGSGSWISGSLQGGISVSQVVSLTFTFAGSGNTVTIQLLGVNCLL